MRTAAERHDLMAKMRRLPTAVETAVKDLTDAQLNTPVSRGDGPWDRWSIIWPIHI